LTSDAAPCALGNPATSNVITVIENPLPYANAGLDQNICNGDSANLTCTGGVTYLWSTTDTTASITVSPSTTTTYYVTVTNSNGCTDSDEIVVNVYETSAVADFIVSINCFSVYFINNYSSASSYYWNFGDGSTSTEENPVHNYATDSIYNVTLIAISPCGNDTVSYNIEVTSLSDELESDYYVNVYPNPNKGTFDIKLVSDEIEDITIVIESIDGQVIYINKLDKVSRELITTVNINNFSKGIYHLEIITGKGVINRQIIVQ